MKEDLVQAPSGLAGRAGRGAQPDVSARDRLVVALDFPSTGDALAMVDRLEGVCKWFKVGMELYYAAGNGLIETLRGRGFEVFLDLKLHDIPNTVAGAVRSVATTGASLLTIHAGGGMAMMMAAAEAAHGPGAPKLLAVTVLTSMDAAELAGVGVSASPAKQVLRLAKLAQESGIGGTVCSAEEVGTLRSALGNEVVLVTPGIRSAGDAVGDQRRVATPAEAIARGASMLVVGRPITKAADPTAAARRILAEICSAE
jgi:orotidine-5'-phosphate decarboxylase